MKNIMILAVAMLFAANAWAADVVQEGKQLMESNCMACHNAELDPPMGPPMFGVQKSYKMVTSDRDAFIDQMTAFTVHPSEDKAVMVAAVEQIGVMPDIGAEEADVRKIAAYLYDETFAPPCVHWQIGMKIAKAKGDKQHFKKDQMMYNRFCANQPASD